MVLPGYTSPGKFSIVGTETNRFLKFTTASGGLSVEFDGNHYVRVKIPGEYNRRLHGLCANFDGNKENDLTTRQGVDVSGQDKADTLFGSSWKIADPTIPE